MAPVHTQRGPTAFWAPGSRPALTPATAPKRWAQREQCPGKARAGSAREDGDNQGLRSPPAHPDASGPAQPGQGLSWTPNQQEGENWGGTGVSAARTLPGGHIFLALGHDPKAGTRCPAERAASCLCPAPLCNPEGGTSPWMPGASRGPSGGGSEEPRMKYRRIQRSQGRGEEGGSHRWPRASCWPSWARNSPLCGSGPRPSEGGAWQEKVLATACSRGVRARAWGAPGSSPSLRLTTARRSRH